MKETKRQELLEKLLAKEMERMRKICFKYMRRPLLFNKIEICEGDLTKEKANGLYEVVDKADDCKFTHKITISKDILDDYFNYKPSKWGIRKGYYKRQILKTVRHEIVHAFVNEVFELVTDVQGTHRDASPIFLSVLYFLEGTSNHDCVQAFLQSQFWKEARKYKTWDELHTYLIQQLCHYRKIATELEEQAYYIDKNNGVCLTNYFQFASREAGLIGNCSNISTYNLAEHKTIKLEVNAWEIGCCIMPQQLQKLVNKKRTNKNFKNITNKKVYIKTNTKKYINKVNNDKYTITTMEEEIKHNSIFS